MSAAPGPIRVTLHPLPGLPNSADSNSAQRVAVVIPCFNDGKFVGGAVASGRDQGAGEVVVVDDGSTDAETHRVLDALERDGVKVVRQPNRGVSVARMTGVAATETPYVHSLDSDDLLAPNVLARMAALLDADSGLDAVWGNVETFGERQFISVTWDGFDPWRLSYLNEVPAAVLFRRSALLAVGGWEAIGYEDWDLSMKGAEQGWRGTKLDEVTLRYRVQATTRRLDLLHATDVRNRAELRRRHTKLYAGRRVARSRSKSRRSVKLIWPLIDALPLLSALQKNRLLHFSRDLLEPKMARSDASTGRTQFAQRISMAITGRGRRTGESES